MTGELKLSRNDVRDRKFEKIQTRLEEIKTVCILLFSWINENVHIC